MPFALQVPGIDGGSQVRGMSGDFDLSGYSFGAAATVADGSLVFDPLVVTIADRPAGFETLLADAANGTALPTVTLFVTDPFGQLVDTVTLSGVTIASAQEANGQAVLALHYASITTTPRHQTADGSYATGNAVTISTAGGSFAAPPAPLGAIGPAPTNESFFLAVAGDAGPSTVDGFRGDFPVAGYALSVGADGVASPLVVDLGALANAVGVSNLYADLVGQTIIPTVTLDLFKAGTDRTIVEEITLTDAVVADYADPGGDVSVSFDFAHATITTRTQTADGTFSAPNTVAIGGTGSAPCYAAGTRIETTAGKRKVEDLAPGDEIVLHDGGTAPIVWIGRRRVDCRLGAEPDLVRPIRIRAGALGPAIPCRDLIVSPDHAILVTGHLVPAQLLLDGVSIIREDCDSVVYYHVELDMHSILLAEDAPAESYLDTGNRAQFSNASLLGCEPGTGREDTRPCRPVLFDPKAVGRLASYRHRLGA